MLCYTEHTIYWYANHTLMNQYILHTPKSMGYIPLSRTYFRTANESTAKILKNRTANKINGDS